VHWQTFKLGLTPNVGLQTPTNAAGDAIPDLEKVSNEDTSEVEKEKHSPGVMVSNTVYLGEDGGKKCGLPDAVEYVAEKVRPRTGLHCTS
jgi:hypothetical protein